MRFVTAIAVALIAQSAFAQDAKSSRDAVAQPNAESAQTAQQLEDLQSQLDALGQAAQSSDTQTAEQLADVQSQVDALAALPAEEAAARRARARSYVEATSQLAELQDALTYGQSDIAAALEDVQAQLDDLAGGDQLGQTPEETRWTRASVDALSVALDELGQRDLFVTRQYLTIAALQLARARHVALGG